MGTEMGPHPYEEQVNAMKERERNLFNKQTASLVELLSWDFSLLLFRLKTWRLRKDFERYQALRACGSNV
jgi:hypothetical protein